MGRLWTGQCESFQGLWKSHCLAGPALRHLAGGQCAPRAPYGAVGVDSGWAIRIPKKGHLPPLRTDWAWGGGWFSRLQGPGEHHLKSERSAYH